MIKVMTAYTTEPTDADYAVQEILTQIEDDLLANSIGFLFCNFEFLESSLVRKLCDRLPFNVLGCVSQGFAVKDAGETFMLVLMVLSSDDVEFVSGISESLTSGDEGVVEALYRDLLAKGPGSTEPAMMFAFPPMCTGLTGNAIVRTLDRVSVGVPVFGSIAVDHAAELRSPRTIYNGEYYADRLPLVLLWGNVKPRFFACSLPRGVRITQNAEITEAEGNRLISINNMPAAAFMEKIGIGNQGDVNIMYAFPIVVDSHDGSEPRLIAISKTDSGGALISEQDVPTSGTVTIGTIDEKLVIESTRYLMDKIKKASVQNGLLVFSCASRVFTLQDPIKEMTLFRQEFADLPRPFLYTYSGGEICPLYKSEKDKSEKDEPGEDKPVNSFHQFTVVACAF
ncbi:MAG: FIST C-terminal domain-containing protein [Treponema sp.]|jgi:hypothetical protein|nr:FIST C-terminal domain-containing protein [Treponema sp.]